MARETFITKKFGKAAINMIAHAVVICDNYAEQGYDLSLRQLYYQFVSKNLIPNTEKDYKNLGNLISDARLAGLLDWDMIRDRGRTTIENPHWSSPADILDSAASSFRLDMWEGQDNHVEVMVEKQALEGVLLPVCNKLDVPFTSNKGYSSSSALYETSKRLGAAFADMKSLHIIYLGDHDPSGIDMSRDVKERLELFTGHEINLHRVALNMEQVTKYQPPENPAKVTDSRAAGYIERFGHSSWELDALEPSLLASLVEEKVHELRTYSQYIRQYQRQQIWKQELSELAERYRNS
jgi:hypothetical protein